MGVSELPFLSRFFEDPKSSISGMLGTQTLTEVSGEDTDSDPDLTYFSPSIPGQADSSSRQRFLGTQTGSKTDGEMTDSDPSSGLWHRPLL